MTGWGLTRRSTVSVFHAELIPAPEPGKNAGMVLELPDEPAIRLDWWGAGWLAGGVSGCWT